MIREFIYSTRFEKSWNKLGLTEDDIRIFEQLILSNPEQGVLIEGTGGLRKVRYALPNKGKSGGVRILYVDFVCYEKIYLVDVFSKNNKDNLTKSEKNDIKKALKIIEENLRR
jgi:hypothetical protein